MNHRFTLVIIVMLVATGVGGLMQLHDASRTADQHAGDAPTARRAKMQPVRFGTAQIMVPASWVALSSDVDHRTFGAADRSQTVTLGDIPASPASPHQSLTRAYRELLRQGKPVHDLRFIGDAPRRSVSIAEFRVTANGDGSADDQIVVRQVWHRSGTIDDQRDLIATWTSRESLAWPVPLRDLVPSVMSQRG